jgi:hypothetical protein
MLTRDLSHRNSIEFIEYSIKWNIFISSIRKDSIGALTLGRGAKGLMAEWLSHLASQFDGEKLR